MDREHTLSFTLFRFIETAAITQHVVSLGSCLLCIAKKGHPVAVPPQAGSFIDVS